MTSVYWYYNPKCIYHHRSMSWHQQIKSKLHVKQAVSAHGTHCQASQSFQCLKIVCVNPKNCLCVETIQADENQDQSHHDDGTGQGFRLPKYPITSKWLQVQYGMHVILSGTIIIRTFCSFLHQVIHDMDSNHH